MFYFDLILMICIGTVLHDVKQKKWVVGKPIGSGAFGDIYLARFIIYYFHKLLKP